MRRYILTLPLILTLLGCATTNGYQQFYTPHVDVLTLTDVQLLKKGEDPVIYSSNNLERDIRILMSKGYAAIGESSFNGSLQGEGGAVDQAKRVGASVVLISSTYTNTQTTTVPMFLPNNSTTYGSGTVYGYGGTASYYGSSTSYGTAVVPITSQQQRFNQTAVYFVKSTKRPRFGIQLVDMTPELRASLQRNAGALVYVALENSPAFYANILPGDVLIRVDGIDVRNVEHALALLRNAEPLNGESQLVILRNAKEKAIKVQLGVNQ